MANVYGIYGYEITETILGPGFTIEPRSNNAQTSKRWARDESSYNLTALVHGEHVDREFLFRLRAILTFIEQREVLISGPHTYLPEEKYKNIANAISIYRTGTPGRSVILEDTYSRFGRPEFIKKSLSLLCNPTHIDTTKYDSLLFRNVEVLNLRRPTVELSYFLYFSGLESHARAVQNDKNSNVAKVVADLLINYGFDVKEQNRTESKKSISSYAYIRNSIFHNSELNVIRNDNGTPKEYKATDYLDSLAGLSNLTILRATDFDDGHINWNSWVDLQPFI